MDVNSNLLAEKSSGLVDCDEIGLGKWVGADIEAKSAYLSDTLGAEINHITISTQEQIRQIALETVQFGNVIAIILPFIFLGLLLGIGRLAGSVTSTVFRGDRPVYEGETPTSYNR